MASFILLFGSMVVLMPVLAIALVVYVLALWILTLLGLHNAANAEGFAVIFGVLLLPAYVYFVVRIMVPAFWFGMVNMYEEVFHGDGMTSAEAFGFWRDRFHLVFEDWVRYRKFIRGRS